MASAFRRQVGGLALVLVSLGAGVERPGAIQIQRDNLVQPVPTGTSSIAGRVVLVENGQTVGPVRRVALTFQSVGRLQRWRVDTDTDGRYRVDRLPSGSYRVTVDKAGFVPIVADLRRAFEPPPEFYVGEGQAVTHDIQTQRGAAIEGTVTTESGEPAAGMMVSAVRLRYEAGIRRPTAIRQVQTDDRGRFRVHTLPPGEYYVNAAPDPLGGARRPQGPDQPPTALGLAYYPGTAKLDEARAVSLVVGQNTTDINFVLATLPVVTLRGRVFDSAGKPATTMMVRVQRVGGPVGEVRGSILPESNEFTYTAVPAGDYWLMGVSRPMPGGALEFAATRLSITGENLTNLTINTAPGAILMGRVEAVGSTTGPPIGLRVIAQETAFALPALPGEGALTPPTTVGADGTFRIAGVFGPRLLRLTGLPEGWVIREITLEGRDIADTPTEFKAGPEPVQIRIIVSADTATVKGTVRDARGRPAAGARVVVFSEDQRQWGPYSRVVRAIDANEQGLFTMTGLTGGRYRAVAVPYLEDGAWTDPEILRRLLGLSTPLTLTDGAAVTIALDLR